MKYTRALAIALAVTATAVALLAATSASATVLCKENTSPCSLSNIYPSGTAIEAKLKSGTELIMESSAMTVACSESTMTGKTTAERGSPLSLTVSGLTIGGCSKGCKTGEARNLPYSATAEQTGAGNGTLRFKNGGSGNPDVRLTGCTIFNVTPCLYSLSEVGLTVGGGNPATISTKKLALSSEEGSNALCPSTVSLTVTYEITTPKPLFVGVGPNNSVLCKENVSVCPASSIYPSGTAIKGQAANVIFKWFPEFSCSSSPMSLETTAAEGKPLPLTFKSLAFEGCEKGCEKVEATAGKPGSVEATSGGNGTVNIPLVFKLTHCTVFNYTCEYVNPEANLEVQGGANPRLVASYVKLPRSAGSGNSCAEVLTFYGEYVAVGGSFWVSRVQT